MSELFEATLPENLAGMLVDELRAVLKSGGFVDVVRVPGPDVTAYRRGDHVVTVSLDRVGGHQDSVRVESESVDVDLYVGEASRQALLRITRHLLGAMPWVERESLERDLDAILQEGLKKS